MDGVLEGILRFHEQPKDEKMKWYCRDYKQPVRYFCNGDLFINKGAANWRDSIAFDFHHGQLDPQLFPPMCRYYFKEHNLITKLRKFSKNLLQGSCK
ncbi:hypothetical protein V6N11_041443 [Hibiscus sabdariffa]|uniref:Uncharacterized protein n=1 Tax=Hibiscus sabdariffa TaxID=183260 RepID=A0ABR2RKG2_9ROSI